MEGGRVHVVVCGSAGRLIALSHAAFALASIQLPLTHAVRTAESHGFLFLMGFDDFCPPFLVAGNSPLFLTSLALFLILAVSNSVLGAAAAAALNCALNCALLRCWPAALLLRCYW